MSNAKPAILVPQPQGQQPEERVHISSFAIVKKGNQLLLVKRTRPEFTAGKWTFPAAIVNYGENPQSAVKRIIKEQLGAEPKSIEILDVQSYGDKHWDLCFVYEVSIDAVGKLSQDIEKAEFFDRSTLPQEFRADHLEVLQTLGSKI
ncbi:MAG: NUDIX hydrolase [Nitrososphaerota archaeon]|nr:NUDIX hydrolase [Nitrososphaerota archaeon]